MDENLVSELRKHEPYKTLFTRGKGWDKEWAKRDCMFVWYMTSKEKNNPYRNLRDSEKWDYIFKELYPSTWKKEHMELVKKVIDKLKFLDKTVEDRLLDGAIHAAEELASYLNKVSFSETTKNGDFLFEPSSVLANIQKIGGVIQSLRVLREEQAKNERTGRVKGGESKGEYED